MSTGTGTTDPAYETVGVDAIDLDSYGSFTLENGDLIVYELANEDAWIQSGAVIDLEEMR